jgi:hypothetical protein
LNPSKAESPNLANEEERAIWCELVDNRWNPRVVNGRKVWDWRPPSDVAPTKRCPACKKWVAVSIRRCPVSKHKFEVQRRPENSSVGALAELTMRLRDET